MTQLIALIVDAYRDLNARKLFWITMILSGVVMAIFSLLIPVGSEMRFAKWHLDVSPFPALFWYKIIFSFGVIGIWLTWAAVALALISTAGLFPDLISGGTIDLYLSKPISLLRLFLIKYLTGLLFVTLQVGVFTVATFLVFGWRAHEWRGSLFLAIPIVVCVFSYLFSFCVLMGVWTRSTIAALLVTVLLWFTFWGLQTCDVYFLSQEADAHAKLNYAQRTIALVDAEAAKLKPGESPSPQLISLQIDRASASANLPEFQSSFDLWHGLRGFSGAACAVIPKTVQTDNLMDRWLFKDEEAVANERRKEERRQARDRREERQSSNPFSSDDEVTRESSEEVATTMRATSPTYIIGTSLLCEAIVVGFAAWIFCRRDY